MLDFLAEILIRIVLTVALVGAYTMFALGIVFIYRGSRVLNLAHGAMAMFPAYIAFSVAKRFPMPVAVAAALLGGGLLGLLVERFVVRRLRAASPTAQTVGTVAVLGLLIGVAVRIWGTTPTRGVSVFPEKDFPVGDSTLALGDIGLFAVAVLVAAGFMALFRYTDLGLALRAAADNRRAAALMGIDPDRTTSVAWFFAGLLAALGGVLLGASTNLHPFTLSLQVLPAFVAVLLGGLNSVSGAVYGSAIVGMAIGIVPTLGGFGEQVGSDKLGLAVLAFIVMSLRGQRFSATDVRSGL